MNRQTHAFLIGLSTLLFCVPGRAGDQPWSRYENQHFVAFSNAPAKRALGLLEDLESFRGAFLQVGNVEIPADAPKTKVLILANKKEFQKLVSNKLQAGFAASDGRSTVIVMPGDGAKGWARTVIRHEYGHALLRFKKFDYPAWYAEGFAELVSSTDVVNKGRSFTIVSTMRRRGENPESATYRYELLADGTVRLEIDESAGDDAGGAEAISLKHRTNDLLCMGANSVAAAECTQVLHRCAS